MQFTGKENLRPNTHKSQAGNCSKLLNLFWPSPTDWSFGKKLKSMIKLKSLEWGQWYNETTNKKLHIVITTRFLNSITAQSQLDRFPKPQDTTPARHSRLAWLTQSHSFLFSKDFSRRSIARKSGSLGDSHLLGLVKLRLAAVDQ